ncbi:MAG: carbon-nitrogen hydrolase family protein [Pseudomonadota bacterium]
MKLALYQCPSPAGDLDAALKTIERALGQACDAGAGILVMPEMYLPGYVAATSTPPPGWDDALARLPHLARAHETALVIGAAEYTESGVYNSAYAFRPDGSDIARYRKIQLFGPDEAALYKPGACYCLFEYGGTRFGLLICYDVEFPEHTRALARAGAQVLLVPTANMMPFETVNQFIVPARAAESALTIVYANYCGSEPPLTYTGQSVISGPDGRPLAQATDEETLLVAAIPNADALLPLSTQLTDFRAIQR